MSSTEIASPTLKRYGESFFAMFNTINLAKDLDGIWAAIHAAYLEHKVLCIPGQKLSAK